MRRPKASLVVVATFPFIAGCVGVVVQPLPAPIERADTEVVGVVLAGPEGERIEFGRVDDLSWSESSLTITGSMERGSDRIETRTFSFDDVGAVLVRGFDGTRASIILAAVLVGTIAVLSFVVTGDVDDGGRIPPGR